MNPTPGTSAEMSEGTSSNPEKGASSDSEQERLATAKELMQKLFNKAYALAKTRMEQKQAEKNDSTRDVVEQVFATDRAVGIATAEVANAKPKVVFVTLDKITRVIPTDAMLRYVVTEFGIELPGLQKC